MKQKVAHYGRQIWLKGTKDECQAEARRLKAEQGIQSAWVVPLDQRHGAKPMVWALCL